MTIQEQEQTEFAAAEKRCCECRTTANVTNGLCSRCRVGMSDGPLSCTGRVGCSCTDCRLRAESRVDLNKPWRVRR